MPNSLNSKTVPFTLCPQHEREEETRVDRKWAEQNNKSRGGRRISERQIPTGILWLTKANPAFPGLLEPCAGLFSLSQFPTSHSQMLKAGITGRENSPIHFTNFVQCCEMLLFYASADEVTGGMFLGCPSVLTCALSLHTDYEPYPQKEPETSRNRHCV